MFLSSVIDTFNFKLLKKREFFRTIRTLHSEFQRLKIETMIEISINTLSSAETLFEKRNHIERAVSVSYVHKCAKMLVRISKLPFCVEKVPVSS